MADLTKIDLGAPMPNVVPFGKYKGRSIVELQHTDPGYLQWLVAQDWFREKFITLHQTIINHGGEPSETPKHNWYQALFLDEKFAGAVFDAVHPGKREEDAREIREHNFKKHHKMWELKSEVKELAGKVAEQERNIEGWSSYCNEQPQEIGRTRKELEVKLKDLAQAWSKLGQKRIKLEQWHWAREQRELEYRQQQLDHEPKRLENRQKNLEQRRRDLEQGPAELERRQQELNAAKAKLDALQSQLEAEMARPIESAELPPITVRFEDGGADVEIEFNGQ